MLVLCNRVSKSVFVIIFTVVCIISAVSIAKAVSQVETHNNPPKILVGFRTAAKPVMEFCEVFTNTLSSKTGWAVERRDILHQYIRRFEGLYRENIAIECGPNSRDALQLQPW